MFDNRTMGYPGLFVNTPTQTLQSLSAMHPSSGKSILFRTGDPNFMNSLARGIEVIRAFSNLTAGLKMSAISKETGLSRAVVRRCLYTLEHMGYVRQSADGFHLEPKILSLSDPYFSPRSLPAIAQEFLDRVKEKTGESCSLAVLDEHEVVYVARSAAQRVMSVSLGIGSRLPAFCTSLGRVLLAALPRKELDAQLNKTTRKRYTDHTKTGIRDLRQIIMRAKQDGFAMVNQELEIGLRSIAVPVFNRRNQTVASINVGVQATRVTQRELRSRILPELQQAAQAISERLPE
ncbi:MAG: helix-turn-helix domain-containing protein [Verrucomicrobia bacterium]|nr:helix-turn-helix domain-containing protein [Verrucomicrobiota bacterium]